MQLNFRDPSIAFRIVIIALGALSTILLIAGTAVDEYVNDGLMTVGCQKISVPVFGSVRVGFSCMSTLALIIIVMTSVLCLLQLIATVLNVLVLLGKGPKPPLILSSIITVLLLAVIIMANVNFKAANMAKNGGAMKKEECIAANAVDKAGNDYARAVDRSIGLRRKRSSSHTGISWGTSYSLLAAAFSFAVFNQILLIAIHKMSKSGVATFGALGSALIGAVMELRDPAKIVRLLITILLGISFILMVQANILDEYVAWGGSASGIGDKPFKEMEVLEIVLFALPILACLSIAISFLLSIMQLVRDKDRTKPLLALSIVSAVLLLGSIVVACLQFKGDEFKGTKWASSFKNIAASFSLCIVVIALNVAGLVLAKRGGGGGGFASSSVVPSTTAPSSVGKPSSNQPSSS